MADDLNPQAQQMADESMVRNLAAQADAIWPQEALLFHRYTLADDRSEGPPRLLDDGRERRGAEGPPQASGAERGEGPPRLLDDGRERRGAEGPPQASGAERGEGPPRLILDAGCGTGEISFRLARMFPRARLLGVDVLDQHLERARARCAGIGDRTRFENRSIFDLRLPDATFDLTVCRHVLQAIPHAERAIAELVRVTRSGGWVHLIAEDYLMIHFEPRRLDPDDFWAAGPRQFGDAIGTDLRIGRKTYGILRRLGLAGITVDYVVVDPLRVPRATFAAIWAAWRDGFADAVSANTSVSREMFRAQFDDMIATLEDPSGYGVWHVPVIAGRVP
jgi:SAM-dependent methyltransferase